MNVTESLHFILLVPLLWLAIGLIGVFTARRFKLISRVLFPVGAAFGGVLAVLSLVSLDAQPQTLILPLGLPSLPFHLRLDALTAFFLLLLGIVAAGISLYAAGHMSEEENKQPGLYCTLYHIFLASMCFVLLADDAYAFMVAWETMALSSFFLVTTEHRHASIRRAGYLYLLIAHIGAIGILLSFGVMAGDAGNYTFQAMRSGMFTADGFWSSAAFLLALFGFGAKSGLLPLHIWLPEAHPAAPSPVSAMMSGVMLKTAVYGMIRVGFDLLHVRFWWWGVLLMALGLCAALFGVIFSAIQSDMKRLLAYSSIDNIGLIFAGLGLAFIFTHFQQNFFAALALTACLYHCLNHAFFKSLLFLCTGSVLHATHELKLGKLGGLIRFMPWVAWISLIGALACAGLPPLNGFISEWLLLQSFLLTSTIPDGYLSMLLPVASAAVALVAALAGFTMVKFFGVIFLGQPRAENLNQAKDANLLERTGLLWLSAGCVLLGIFPNTLVRLLDPLMLMLLNGQLHVNEQADKLWLLAPMHSERASYSPLVFLLTFILFTPLVFWLIRRFFQRGERRVDPWDCGFPLQTARMQDTAEGFGQPIRRIFSPFMRRTREHPSPFDTHPYYKSEVEDHFWYWLYVPITRLVEFVTRFVAFLQQGRIALYLLYSFITLLILLLLARG